MDTKQSPTNLGCFYVRISLRKEAGRGDGRGERSGRVGAGTSFFSFYPAAEPVHRLREDQLSSGVNKIFFFLSSLL